MKLIFVIVSFIFSLSVYADVTGQWECNTCGETSVKLTLNEKDRNVSGSYCFISNNGNRIDCDGNNISGEINGNIAKIKFVNSWGDVGKANLTIDQENITWHTDDGSPFLHADMAMPVSFTLRRLKADSSLHAKVIKKCSIRNDIGAIDGSVNEGQLVVILGVNDDGDKFKVKVAKKNENLVGWLSDECVCIE